MFKDYLQYRPKGVQLSVFLFLWAAFYLIAALSQNAIIKGVFHLEDVAELQEFMTNALVQHPDFIFWANSFFSFLVFALPAFIFAYLAGPQPRFYLGLRTPKDKRQLIWVVLLSLGMIPLITLLANGINELDLGATAKKLQEVRENQINEYLKTIGPLGLVRNMLLLAAVPAFCEEMMFRGLVQKFAYSYTKKAWAAILISGLLFSLVHLSVYEFLPILLAGMVLAWVYQNTGCLWLNVLLHFLFNGLQVLLSYLVALHPDWENALDNGWWYLVIGGVGGLIFWVAIRGLQRTATPYDERWQVEQFQEGLPIS